MVHEAVMLSIIQLDLLDDSSRQSIFITKWVFFYSQYFCFFLFDNFSSMLIGRILGSILMFYPLVDPILYAGRISAIQSVILGFFCCPYCVERRISLINARQPSSKSIQMRDLRNTRNRRPVSETLSRTTNTSLLDEERKTLSLYYRNS